MRIKKILLELDPQKDNQAALDRAGWIASGFKADVDIVVCQPPQVIPAVAPAGAENITAAHNEYRADVENWAGKKVAKLVEAGIAVSVTTTEQQPRYEAILEQADSSNADLIIRVVGEHDRLKRLFLGLTDWDLIRHSKYPLWLVQPDSKVTARSNVMAAVDPMHPGDEHMKLDKRLLDFAQSLSKATSGEVHAYHTYELSPMLTATASDAPLTPPLPQVDVGTLEDLKSKHKANLEELVAAYGLADDHVHMLEGDPAAEIDEVIEANDIGIVVAGAISRSWLDRLLVGSTAESLLDAVSCDLVLLRAES